MHILSDAHVYDVSYAIVTTSEAKPRFKKCVKIAFCVCVCVCLSTNDVVKSSMRLFHEINLS